MEAVGDGTEESDRLTSGVRLQQEDAVAVLTLNRPESGNAIDLTLARSLLNNAIACAEDPTVRCVVLTGAGKYFCTGGDINSFAGACDNLPATLRAITANLHAAMSCLLRMDKPLVSAVNGPAAGAGVGLALLGDVAIATPATHFSMAYTKLGLTPDAMTSWLLPRFVGLRRAQAMYLFNERLVANQALASGMLTEVVDSRDFSGRWRQLAAELAAGPVRSFASVRRLLLESFTNAPEAQMALESETIARSGGGIEARELIEAFQNRSTATR